MRWRSEPRYLRYGATVYLFDQSARPMTLSSVGAQQRPFRVKGCGESCASRKRTADASKPGAGLCRYFPHSRRWVGSTTDPLGALSSAVLLAARGQQRPQIKR
jgi:hypothetical protein